MSGFLCSVFDLLHTDPVFGIMVGVAATLITLSVLGLLADMWRAWRRR